MDFKLVKSRVRWMRELEAKGQTNLFLKLAASGEGMCIRKLGIIAGFWFWLIVIVIVYCTACGICKMHINDLPFTFEYLSNFSQY